MTGCARNRKALALLAIGALEAAEAEALRGHAASCATCRGYLREIEQVASHVRAAESPEEFDPSPFLRRRARQAVRLERPRPNLLWRLIVPALAAIVYLVFVFPRSRSIERPTIVPVPLPAPSASAAPLSDPSLINYQMAANQSLDKLDAILTEQGNRELPSAPIYRAGRMPSGNAAD